MKRPGVRLSVCPAIRPPHTASEGLLLSAVPRGDIGRQLGGRRAPSKSGAAARRSAANASSVTLTADVGN